MYYDKKLTGTTTLVELDHIAAAMVRVAPDDGGLLSTNGLLARAAHLLSLRANLWTFLWERDVVAAAVPGLASVDDRVARDRLAAVGAQLNIADLDTCSGGGMSSDRFEGAYAWWRWGWPPRGSCDAQPCQA